MTLRIERMDWHFQDGATVRRIFDGLDLSFESGTSYAVTGPSGCGKTTLLSILSLICRPTAGRVVYCGEDLSALDVREAQRFRRDNIGLIFQTFRLLEHLTVREQVLFTAGIRRQPDCVDKGLGLLREFGLGDSLGRLPRQLSGGEKQRVALAQALMFGPRIVLADEPTAALDGDNSEMVSHVLTNYALQAQAIVVAVSHDRRVVKRCSAEVPLGR